jgi:hypothetical protein
MASLDDLLSATKNFVLALGNAAKTYLDVQGVKSSPAINTTTLVQSGAGRVASLSVIVAGSANGIVYDALSTAAYTAADRISIIPTTVGVHIVNMPVSSGIVVAPGTGQTVTISYS